MNWYLKCLKNYTVFEGRARRKEFWMFQLVSSIIFLVLYFAGYALLKIIGIGVDSLIPFIVYGLYIIPPTMAVTVRRLHDIGKSGLYLLLFVLLMGLSLELLFEIEIKFRHWKMPAILNEYYPVILVLGNLIPWVVFLGMSALLCKDSCPKENKYGPNPKKVEA